MEAADGDHPAVLFEARDFATHILSTCTKTRTRTHHPHTHTTHTHTRTHAAIQFQSPCDWKAWGGVLPFMFLDRNNSTVTHVLVAIGLRICIIRHKMLMGACRKIRKLVQMHAYVLLIPAGIWQVCKKETYLLLINVYSNVWQVIHTCKCCHARPTGF